MIETHKLHWLDNLLVVAQIHVLVEPVHSLQESLLLCELLPPVAEVHPAAETVLNVRVEAELVGYIQLLQDLLRLMALFGREPRVMF